MTREPNWPRFDGTKGDARNQALFEGAPDPGKPLQQQLDEALAIADLAVLLDLMNEQTEGNKVA